MGLPKSKSGGKQKGTLNKKTVFSVASLLVDKNIDPIEEIMKLLPDLRPHEQLRAWLELLQYCDAKRKSVEVELQEAESDNEKLFDAIPRHELIKLAKGAS